MEIQRLRIASRQSPMALKQTELVKTALLKKYPELSIEVCGFTTKGDEILDRSLAKIGGKGLFTKELENALLVKQADFAVHSCKDMPVQLPYGFSMMSIMPRDDASDAFVSNQYTKLAELPAGATVGTSSLRRTFQLKAMRPDIEIKLLRGNVNTRLKKLDDGEFDAVILATAGLQRLNLEERIQEKFSYQQMLPAVAQGALCVEFLEKNVALKKILQSLHHPETEICMLAERAVSQTLKADCHTPLGVYAQLDSQQISLHTVIGMPDGSKILRANVAGPSSQATQVGIEAANQLLEQGAQEILDFCHNME